MADESETPLDPGCGDLDELLIFGNPETRRQFIKLVASTGVAISIGVNFVSASAVAAEQPAATPSEDLQAAARERVRNTAASLNPVALPMSTEPAFQFKA